MNSYTKNGTVVFLTRLFVWLLLGNGYAYAQLTASNVCPSTTVDLTARVASTPASGTIVTWHTGTPATLANRVADPTKVGAGVYYAAFYDVAFQCYGSTTGSVTVTITACAPVNNVCPATTVDLTTRVTGTPPAGSVITWHTSATATAANQIADPTRVGTGLYYAAYFNAANQCYGNTTSPLSVSIVPCPTVTPDNGTVIVGIGGTAINSVVANDLIGTQPATLGVGGNATIAPVGPYPAGIALNTGTGAVTVAAAVPPGTYTVVYQLCTIVATPSCATTTATITVSPNSTAAPDAGTVSAGTGGTAVANVAANDIVNGQPATLGAGGNATLASVGTYPAGITLNPATGSISVAVGTAPGSYTVSYQLCDRLTPVTCATTTATITVAPSVTASPDAGTALASGGTAIASVTTNDVVNGVVPVLSGAATNAVLTTLSAATGVTLNAGTGSVNVASGTPPGTYTLVYQLCTTASPVVCATTTATVTVQGPDLTVAIGQPAPGLLVGQISSLPVTVSNIGVVPTFGPSSFTLSIPASVTAPAAFTSNGFTCTTSGTLVSCSSPAIITNGASTTVQVPITPLAASAGTSPVISATVVTANESNRNNNTATTTVGPVAAPDLTILIGQATPALVVGQTSIVPITVSNIGTSPTAGPVSFTLSVPASVTVPATFTSNGFGCVTSGTLVSCSSPAVISNGASTTVQVPITPLPAATGTSPVLSATVAVANEGNPNNNTATTTINPAVVAPDLTVSIGQPSPVLTIGLTSTVPVIVSNIGTAPTSGLVSFTLSIPVSTTAPAAFTSSGFGCVTSGTLVSCSSSATILNGGNVTVSIPVTATAVATNPVFSATVITANESNPNNNTATITASAVLAPDLTVSLNQPAPVLVAGQTSSLPVTISNIGTTTTLGPVSFTLSIPANVTASATFTSNGFSCATSGTRVSCSSSAVLASGTSTTLAIPITPQNAAVGTSPVFSGTVATIGESNVNNNTAVVTVTTPVAGQPDLIISVGQPSPNLVVGQTSSVPVSLSNIGTASTAGPVSFTLSIPANVTASATFTSNGFGCVTSGTLVSCSSPTSISNGAGITVLVPITPLPAATGTSPVLSATVATGNESNPNNNTTTTTVAVPVVAPDLIIALGQPSPALVVGQTSSLPVSLSNIGSAPTAGLVSFTVTLPASMTAPAAFTTNTFSCTTSGALVSCASSVTITNGASTTAQIPVTPLTALAGTSPVISATVATANESNLLNNTATTTVTVSASVVASPDSGTVSAGTGGVAVANVRANDVVNSAPATLANSVLSSVGTYPVGISLDPATGSVSVAVGTTPGSYTVSYQLCDRLTPATCATTTATITVAPSVTASPDAGTAPASGGAATPNVAANDLVNGLPATLGAGGNATLASVGTYPAGISLDPTTGIVSVAAGTVPGSYTVAYQLCDRLTPVTCTTGLVSLTIAASVTASPDAGTVSAGTGGTAVANVAANDIVNGLPATLGTGGNATVAALGTYPAGISLNTTTGSVSVAIGTTPGSYTVSYQLCDRLTPTTCATTVAVITVTPSVTASPDAGTVSAGAGGIAVANVRTNDLVNGVAATAANSTLASVGTYPAGITLDPATGSVSVAAGTVPGSYTIAYQLCDLLTPATCATTVAVVTVAPSVTAGPDSGTTSTTTGGTVVASVVANDVVNGQPATLGAGGNATIASVGTYPAGIDLNIATGAVTVAIATVPGTYTLAYQLCDRLTTPTCTTGLLTITVTASVTASPDAGTVSAGTGGVAISSVAANDVVNSLPATVGAGGNATVAGVGIYPAGITLDLNTGSVSVAVGTAPGSYTIAYQLCDRLTPATCATTTATITVAASVTAAPDAGTVSTGTGGTAVANVAANDLVNGVPATLGTGGNATLASVGTYPVGISLDPATGSVSVAVGTTPGSYTVSYQLCDRLTPVTCATTTVAITVTPSLTASPDAGTAPASGGAATPNVAANDLVNGLPATLGAGGNATLASVGTYPAGISLDPNTGVVSVAAGTVPGSYTVAYQLCDRLTPVTCTTGLVSLTIAASVTAAPDAGTVSAGTGGTAVANVAINDVVNGVPATLGAGGNATVASVGTYPAGISLNPATGSVSVALGTAPGSYTIAYQLCDQLTPVTCATTVAVITVTPSLTANADAGTVDAGAGGIIVANVAANDVVNGVPATLGAGGNATVASLGTYPPGITLDPTTGSLSVAVGTEPGSYTVAYQLCDRLTIPTCTTGITIITITASLTANSDGGTAPASGGVAIANVAANDIVNGQPAILGPGGNATLASVSLPPGITFNPATGSVAVAVGTVPGNYLVAYELCDRITPITCTTGLAAITVLPSVVAVADAGAEGAASGGVAVPNVAANDVVNGLPATLGAGGNATLTALGTYPPGITLTPATGSVSVAVGTVPGSYTVAYQLCDRLTPVTCATTTVTVMVLSGSTASPDNASISTGTGGIAVANVAANDVVNGQSATLGAGGNATVASVGTYPPGISLNPATGSVSVAVGTVPGSYTIAYQLCDRLTPVTCTTGLVSLTIAASVTAGPDSGTVSAGAGGVAVANITANDIVNGQPATLGAGGNATLAPAGSLPAGISLNPATGSISVAVGTIPGDYLVPYQLCDRLSPVTCTTGLATITVTPNVTASPDSGTAPAGGGVAVANVVANDIVNGLPATLGPGGNATLASVGTYPPGVSLDPNTGALNVAVGTAPGSYTVAYQLCDQITPITCTTGLLTITVTPSVTASPDSGTVSAGTGGTAVANIATNDVVNGLPATLGAGGNATLASAGSLPTGISLDPATGSVSVAIGTTPGIYTVSYQLCDRLTPVTCATTVAVITVTPSVTASPDAGTVSAGPGGVVVANIAVNDVVNGLLATLGAGGNATVAPLGVYPVGISLDPATGSVSVATGTVPGSYTVGYQLCDRLTPTTCATATATVTVTSSLTARPDNATLVGGFSLSLPILTNDANPNGSPVTDLTQVSLPLLTASGPGAPTKGTAAVNPDGSLSYTANIASTGIDTFTYSICDRLNPGQCVSTTVTITISPNRSVVLSPKAYLQGALFGVAASNPLMRDDLRSRSLIPATSPYGMMGLTGLSSVGPISSGVLSVTGTDAIVDWVFVELRSGGDPTLVIDSRAALLQRDGDIVEVDGVSSLSFAAAQSGSFFVGVRHRNHLGVLTATATPLNFSVTVVDFRSPLTAVYNLNAGSAINQAQVVVDQGRALWAGNALFDREVIYQGPGNDVNVLSQQVSNAPGNVFGTPSYKLRGYFSGDINLNGEVIFQGSGNDVDFIYQNITKNHPGNSLRQNSFKIREQLP